eukprot:4559854-Ditylum_brightwellii.AAC.1
MDQPCGLELLIMRGGVIYWFSFHISLCKGIAEGSRAGLELEHNSNEQHEAKCCPLNHWRIGVNVVDSLLLKISSNVAPSFEGSEGTTGESLYFHCPGDGNTLNTLWQLKLRNQGP